jgi:hypothetical protein
MSQSCYLSRDEAGEFSVKNEHGGTKAVRIKRADETHIDLLLAGCQRLETVYVNVFVRNAEQFALSALDVYVRVTCAARCLAIELVRHERGLPPDEGYPLR